MILHKKPLTQLLYSSAGYKSVLVNIHILFAITTLSIIYPNFNILFIVSIQIKILESIFKIFRWYNTNILHKGKHHFRSLSSYNYCTRRYLYQGSYSTKYLISYLDYVILSNTFLIERIIIINIFCFWLVSNIFICNQI